MINIRGPLVRLLVVSPFGSSLSSDYDLDGSHRRLILKTKGHRLDEMDVIFGVVQEDKRRVDIAQQRSAYIMSSLSAAYRIRFLAALIYDALRAASMGRSADQKVE